MNSFKVVDARLQEAEQLARSPLEAVGRVIHLRGQEPGPATPRAQLLRCDRPADVELIA